MMPNIDVVFWNVCRIFFKKKKKTTMVMFIVIVFFGANLEEEEDSDSDVHYCHLLPEHIKNKKTSLQKKQ